MNHLQPAAANAEPDTVDQTQKVIATR